MKTVALTLSMNETDFYLRRRYIDWLNTAGVLPVILPSTCDVRFIREYAHRFDGFILTGGGDIDPNYYGEEKKKACVEIHRLRDEFELNLIRFAAELDKPTLGICRGMQVMNIAFGGTLFGDIAEAGFISHTESETPKHTVDLCEKGLEIFDRNTLVTNSYHHQSVAKVGGNIRVFAHTPDGLAEGIYHPGLRFFLGVQWHPEFEPDGNSEKLLDSFVWEVKA